jgi:hypothetical protein
MMIDRFVSISYSAQHLKSCGRIAQLVRAPALQAGGQKFESSYAHHDLKYELT